MQPNQDIASVHSQNEVTLTSNMHQEDMKKMSYYDNEEKNISVPSIVDQEEIAEEAYPGLVECAPFPSLASIDEITRTLTKTRTNQTPKNQRDNDSLKTATVTDDQLKGENRAPRPIGEYYGTEGYRNPGWMSVMATFLVNFFVSSNFLELQVVSIQMVFTNELLLLLLFKKK